MTSENHQLKELIGALEQKNKQLIARLTHVLKEENQGRLSVMDFKLAFDKAAKDIEKAGLLAELRAVRD